MTEAGSFRSRRAVIGAALGGAAAVAAQAALPLGVRAATGDGVLLGKGSVAGENTADAVTIITNTAEPNPLDPTVPVTSLAGVHAGAGSGVLGTSGTAAGVRGVSGDATFAMAQPPDTGVYGFSDNNFGASGVWGDTSQGIGVYGTGDWAVYGTGYSASVVGDADTNGLGVMGYSGDFAAFPDPLPAGVGVFAAAGSTAQTALQVSGKVKFSRSKRVSIGATKTSLRVSMGGVSSASYVLATLQTSVSGCYVRAVVPGSGYFTIYLSKAPGKTVYVGYMVIN